MTSKRAQVTVDAGELLFLLNRALNCLDPQKAPQWALDLTDGLLPTDDVIITLYRQEEVEEVLPG